MNRWLHKGANWGAGAPRREYSAAHWQKPLRWNEKAKATGKTIRVFPSVCDPFDNEIDPQWLCRFFDLMHATPNLTWLLLTKRIGNAHRAITHAPENVLPNVWLGATVVNQEEADRDIPKLLGIPAAVRFLSCEPLLGPIDLEYPEGCFPGGPAMCCDGRECGCRGQPIDTPLIYDIDWVIAGGESGRQARPSHPDWFRSLRDQCAAWHKPFLFKQHGEWVSVSMVEGKGAHFSFPDGATVRRVGKRLAGNELDGEVIEQWPI